MKFEVNETMKRNIITYVIVAVISIGAYFIFFHFSTIRNYMQSLFRIIAPFIWGFALAFLLNKPMEFVEFKLLKNVQLKEKSKHTIASVIALIFGIVVFALFLLLLLPQLFDSMFSLIQSFPDYIDDFQVFVLDLAQKHNFDLGQIEAMFGDIDFFEKLSSFVSSALPQMAKFSYGLASGVLNTLVAIMAAFYMMLEKTRFLRYVKKMNYAFFPTQVSTYLHRTVITSADIFNNFIVGKAIDSLIIGILCYIGMLVLNLPYAILLSVIVGITNMIPVFGPFIGAIPGVFILLIIHPIYSVYFAIFIFLLQQFDGNILGPLILGDKLGIPSLFILFSVCVGGAMFGVVGMFIGVPAFTVLYIAVKELVNYRLDRKGMEVD